MVDRDAVRRGYDELADVYAAERIEDDERTARVAQLLDSLPGEPAVLDAGCGNGRPVLATAAERASACGLDVSDEQLRRAATNVPPARLVQGELTDLPFAANSFDAVVALWS